VMNAVNIMSEANFKEPDICKTFTFVGTG